MIGDLVKGKEKSDIVLLKDCIDADGRPLLASFLVNLCNRLDEVRVICFDRKSEELSKVISSQNSSRVHFHDGHSDVLGWNGSSSLNVHTDLATYLQSQGSFHSEKKIAVVIDSLSPLLLHRPVPYTCQTIHRLRRNEVLGAEVEQVVCLLHGDLHDNHTLALVEHTSSSIVTMQSAKEGDHLFCCNTLHKRPSGKVFKITEKFNLTQEFDITDVKEMKLNTLPVSTNTSEQVDPAANLTFNLSLSDKEKEDRSKVKLPYMYHEERQDTSVGERKIFYQPDDADDFDEEDPDDDLDI